MPDPQTYDELKTSVEFWSVRDDLTDQIPEFIALAERKFNREVYTPERVTTATLSASSETVALPSGFRGAKAVWLDTDPKSVLDPMSLDELRQHYSASTTGQPGNYAIEGSNMILGPAPDATYSVKLSYWQSIPALTDDDPTNWLLTDHPDLYLAGSLEMLFRYLRDDARRLEYAADAANIIERINRAGIRQQHGGGIRIRSAVVV